MGSPRIGFVGAGRLGLPMVERLAAAGHELTVHARRPEARSALERLGARPVSELREAAAGTDVLLICVFSDEQLAEIVGPLAEVLPDGAVLASHVTGREATVADIARRFPGIEVVDAPVSGVAANTQLVAEAVRLGRALGLAPEPLLGALNHMSGGSQASRRAAENDSLAEFAARIGPFVRKDVAACLEQAAERGTSPGLLIDVVRQGPLALI